MTRADFFRAYRFGFRMAAAVPLLAAAEVAGSVVSQVSGQYAAQLLAALMSALGMNKGEAPNGGLLGMLVPTAPGYIAAFFVAATAIGISTSLGLRSAAIRADTRMASNLQLALHDKLLSLSPAYHRSHGFAETSTIALRFANTAQGLLKELAYSPWTRGIPFLTAVMLLGANLMKIGPDLPWEMMVFIVAAIVAVPVFNNLLLRRAAPALQQVRGLDIEVAREFRNSLETPNEVVLMGAFEQRHAQFKSLLERVRQIRVRSATLSEVSRQLAMSAPDIAQAAVLVFCVILLSHKANPAALGALFAVYYFMPKAMSPVQQMVQFVNMLQSSWPQIEPVLDTLELQAVYDFSRAPRSGLAAPTAVQVTDLALEVGGEGQPAKALLSGVNLTIPRGATAAIIGRSGSGKTTLLLCLTRLLRPTAGAVLLNGQALSAIPESQLRRQVSILSQFPLLIEDTLRRNFQLVDPEISDARIQELCREAGVWDAVAQAAHDLPDALDLMLSIEAGKGRLSGGQRRLLSLARALCHEPLLLLYDEPTTGVDLITQGQILDCVRNRAGRVTQIIIDHNPDFISAACDIVFCIDRGRIVASGSPQELIETGPDNLFRQLHLARQRMAV